MSMWGAIGAAAGCVVGAVVAVVSFGTATPAAVALGVSVGTAIGGAGGAYGDARVAADAEESKLAAEDRHREREGLPPRETATENGVEYNPNAKGIT